MQAIRTKMHHGIIKEFYTMMSLRVAVKRSIYVRHMLSHDFRLGAECFVLLPQFPPHTTQWNGWELVRGKGAHPTAVRNILESMSIAQLKAQCHHPKSNLHILGRDKMALVERLVNREREWSVEDLAKVYTNATHETEEENLAFGKLVRKLHRGIGVSEWCPPGVPEGKKRDTWAMQAIKAMIVCSANGREHPSSANAHIGRTITFCSMWRGMFDVLKQLQDTPQNALAIRSIARRDVAAYVVTKALRWYLVQREKVAYKKEVAQLKFHAKAQTALTDSASRELNKMFRIKTPGVVEDGDPASVRPLRFKLVKYRSEDKSDEPMQYHVRAAIVPWQRQIKKTCTTGLPVVQFKSKKTVAPEKDAAAEPLSGTEASWALQEFNVPGVDCFADIFFYVIASPMSAKKKGGGSGDGDDMMIVGTAWLPSWAVFRQSTPTHRECAGLQQHKKLQSYLKSVYGSDPNEHESVKAVFDASVTDATQVFRTFQLQLQKPPSVDLWETDLKVPPHFGDSTMKMLSRRGQMNPDMDAGAISVEFDACGPEKRTWCGAVSVRGASQGQAQSKTRWCVLAGPCLYLYDCKASDNGRQLQSPFEPEANRVKYEPVTAEREIIDLKTAVVSELLATNGELTITIPPSEVGAYSKPYTMSEEQPSLKIGPPKSSSEGGEGGSGGAEGDSASEQGGSIGIEELHARLHSANEKAQKQPGTTHMGRFEGFGLDDMQPHVELQDPLPFCERWVVTYYDEWEPIAEGGAYLSASLSLLFMSAAFVVMVYSFYPKVELVPYYDWVVFFILPAIMILNAIVQFGSAILLKFHLGKCVGVEAKNYVGWTLTIMSFVCFVLVIAACVISIIHVGIIGDAQMRMENLTDTTPLEEINDNWVLQITYQKISAEKAVWDYTQEKKGCCGWKFPHEYPAPSCAAAPRPACAQKILRHHMNFWGAFLGVSIMMVVVHAVTLFLQFALMRWTSEAPPQTRHPKVKVGSVEDLMKWGVALVAVSLFAMMFNLIVIVASWITRAMPEMIILYSINMCISTLNFLATPVAMVAGKALMKMAEEKDPDKVEAGRSMRQILKWILRIYAIFNVITLVQAAVYGITYTVYFVAATDAYFKKRSITFIANPWIAYFKLWIEVNPRKWQKMQNSLGCCGFDTSPGGIQNACQYCTSHTYMGNYCSLNTASNILNVTRNLVSSCQADVNGYVSAYSFITALVALVQMVILIGMTVQSFGISFPSTFKSKTSVLDQLKGKGQKMGMKTKESKPIQIALRLQKGKKKYYVGIRAEVDLLWAKPDSGQDPSMSAQERSLRRSWSTSKDAGENSAIVPQLKVSDSGCPHQLEIAWETLEKARAALGRDKGKRNLEEAIHGYDNVLKEAEKAVIAMVDKTSAKGLQALVSKEVKAQESENKKHPPSTAYHSPIFVPITRFSVVAVPEHPDAGCWWTAIVSDAGTATTTRISLQNEFYHQLLSISADGRGTLQLRPTRKPSPGRLLMSLPTLVKTEMKKKEEERRKKEGAVAGQEGGAANPAAGSRADAPPADHRSQWQKLFDGQRRPADSIFAVDDPIEEDEGGQSSDLIFSIEGVKSKRYLGLTPEGGSKAGTRGDPPMLVGTHTRRFCTAETHNVSSFEIVERNAFDDGERADARSSEGGRGCFKRH